jgi:hypothetical protein
VPIHHRPEGARPPHVRRAIDFAQPVAVLLLAILHFVTDEKDLGGIVAHLRAAMAPGSYLVLSHATADFNPDTATKAAQAYDHASVPIVLRSRAEIERLYQGSSWSTLVWSSSRRGAPTRLSAQGQDEVWAYAGVGRKRR